MKFNYKRIASILATTVMLGSTVAFAAAAYPAPFVNSGSGDSAVVVGSSAVGATDMAAATSIMDSLNSKVTVTGTTAATEGDKFQLQKTTNLFNLGENMSEFYSTIDNEQLSKVLADGVYTNDANNEFDFEQKIVLGTQLKLKHFLDSDFNDNKPAIGFDLTDGTYMLNYTLDFTDVAENTVAFGAGTSTAGDDLETTQLTMLGVTYYIQKVEGSTAGVKLTLLDNANSATVTEGETKTVTVGDKTYTVNLNFVDSSNTILEVDGVKTNKLAEGGVFKIGTDTYVSVKSILYNAKESGISQVEFSIGSGKIVLENGKEMLMNGEAISDLTDPSMKITANIQNDTDSTISKIAFQWDLDDDNWLATGGSLVLPGFETIKLSMAGFSQPKAEKTTLKEDGDTKFTLWTTIKDGDLKLPLLYNNATNILGVGEKSTHLLVSSNASGNSTTSNSGSSGSTSVTIRLDEATNDYFVATWISGKDFESYAYEINGIADDTGKNATTLKNLVTGGSDIVFSEVGKDRDRGNINFLLAGADDDDKYANITISSSTGAVYVDRLVTKEGMRVMLPIEINPILAIADANAELGELNLTVKSTMPTSWKMNISEEDKDGNVAGTLANNAKSVLITSAVSTDGMEPTTFVNGVANTDFLETVDGSNIYEAYVLSPLATKLVWDKPTSGANALDITYAGEESSAAVYVSEAAVSFTGSTSVKVVKDTEIDSVKDKNLVVVGGSCINAVAAKLLGSDAPMCGSAFSTQTTVGAGQYLIQVLASPYNAQKVAMLVAGYEAAETTAAATVVNAGTTSTDVGTKVVGPTAA